MSKVVSNDVRRTRREKILSQFKISDEAVEERLQDRTYTEVKEEDPIANSLEGISGSIPEEEVTEITDTRVRQMNMDAIRELNTSFSTAYEEADLDFPEVQEGVSPFEGDAEASKANPEDEDLDFFKEGLLEEDTDQTESQLQSSNLMDEETLEGINLGSEAENEENLSGTLEDLELNLFEVEQSQSTKSTVDLDKYTKVMEEYDVQGTIDTISSMEALGGGQDSQVQLQKQPEPTQQEPEPQPEPQSEPEPQFTESSDLAMIASSITKATQLLKDIEGYQIEIEQSREDRTEEQKEDFSDLDIPLDIEMLKTIEAKVYNVPDDIKTYYINSAGTIEKISKSTPTKITNLDTMLDSIKTDISPTVLLLVNRRRIIDALTKNLLETGKHYVVAQELFPASLTSNIEIIERDGKQYYAFVNIPASYTGYRTPLHNFVNDLKEGINKNLLESGELVMRLIDENNINILTLSEFRTIIKFLDSLDLYYRIDNNNLIITY